MAISPVAAIEPAAYAGTYQSAGLTPPKSGSGRVPNELSSRYSRIRGKARANTTTVGSRSPSLISVQVSLASMAASSGAQVPAGQGQEHVLQVGVVGAEVVGGDPPAGQGGGHPDGHRAAAGDLDGVAPPGHPLHPVELGQPGGVRARPAEADPLAGVAPADQLRRGPGGHHPSLVDDGQAVTQLLGLLHEVGDQDDGGA